MHLFSFQTHVGRLEKRGAGFGRLPKSLDNRTHVVPPKARREPTTSRSRGPIPQVRRLRL